MKLIYAGTPEFAVPALAKLIAAGHEVALVLTQPDRPAGRGMKLKASPVKELALQHGIQVFQPETLKPEDVQARISSLNADAMIVAAYGLIIPKTVLDMPKLGCFNIHASLLPRWRGAAPIQRSILANDAETGVTIMRVVPALDAGAMLKKVAVPITENDTAQTLHNTLSEVGGALMVEVLAELDHLEAEEQDESQVTYAAKLLKTEAPINWHQSADELARQVRAFNPFPVAQAVMKDEAWRIWFARVTQGSGLPGEVIAVNDGIVVACGTGALRIEELQKPGGKRMSWKDFIGGAQLKPGDRFET
ncbi:methionyl-tRNA formyltransferase [Novimethylophilus kurashikiensis]|uniref:Methionyl-tRNA formyltransferase n=1 Tax=Novimethylophilus kurashikiensis TaxID=1825523 RepID=A0A2R5F6E7_9PROT|nr:methionyl-tRNA formyltransferase [Novimethylophilus kurashikiensis]GBG13807.1 methionyl-tRNA formyltransferase [Novimethylophilus kurashikiensis]